MAAVSVTSVGHTGITVSNLDRAIAFYRDILGLPVSHKIHASGELFERITGVQGADLEACFVRAPGHVIELIQYSKPDERTSSTLRACDSGAVHIALKVKDIEGVVVAIRGGGFKTAGPVQVLPEGPLKGMKVVYARDPDGVVLELIEEPPGVIMEELFLSSSSNLRKV